VDSEQFKAFLDEKDRSFISSAASELFPDIFPAEDPEKPLEGNQKKLKKAQST
jgi:hypothetical protein